MSETIPLAIEHCRELVAAAGRLPLGPLGDRIRDILAACDRCNGYAISPLDYLQATARAA